MSSSTDEGDYDLSEGSKLEYLAEVFGNMQTSRREQEKRRNSLPPGGATL